MLRRVPRLRTLPALLLRELVMKLAVCHGGAGETICERGKPLTAIYFVKRGILEVLMSHDFMLSSLFAGDYFGELAFLPLGLRTTHRSQRPFSAFGEAKKTFGVLQSYFERCSLEACPVSNRQILIIYNKL